MFLLPSGPAAPVEGQNALRPIVLEGYKAADFAALLKVMYPTYVPSFTDFDILGMEVTDAARPPTRCCPFSQAREVDTRKHAPVSIDQARVDCSLEPLYEVGHGQGQAGFAPSELQRGCG